MRSMTPEELTRWFRNPGDLDVWEDIASWFHRETGHLRPGKDKPIGFHQTAEGESDCCNDAWIRWSSDKRDAAVRGLRARVAELEQERDTLKEMVTAMDEANTQLAHRLWCLENPE